MGACVSTHAELLKELKKNEENKLILENLKQNQEQFMALTKSLNALVTSPKLLELPAAAPTEHVQGNEQCGCKCNCHAKLDEAGAKSLLLAALNLGDLNNLANKKLKNLNVSDENEADYGKDTMSRRRHKNKLVPTRNEHEESLNESDFHQKRANSYKRSMNHESGHHQEYQSHPNPNHIIIVNNSSTRSSGDSMDFVNSKKYIKNSIDVEKTANVECKSLNSNFILYDFNEHQACAKEFAYTRPAELNYVTRDSQEQTASKKLKCKQCEYAIRSYKPRHANEMYDVKNTCKKLAAAPRHQSVGIQAADHLYRKPTTRKIRHNLVRTKSDFQKSLNFLSQKNFLNGLHSDEDSLDSSLLHALDKEETAFFANQKDLRKLNRCANSPASKLVHAETEENSMRIRNFFTRENMTSESVVNESEVLQFDKLSISDNTSSYSVLPIIFDPNLNKTMSAALKPNDALVGKQMPKANLAKLDLSCSTTSKSASSSSMSLESSLNFSLEHPPECFKEKKAESALLTRVMALSDHDDVLEATRSSKEDVKSLKSENFDKLKLRSIVDTIGFVLFPSAGFTHKAFKLLLMEKHLYDLFQ